MKGVLQKIEQLEEKAHGLIAQGSALLDATVALKEELSGGSGSSNLSVIPKSHKKIIIARRRRNAMK